MVRPGETIDEDVAAALLPERDPRGHKGTFGRVVAVAGSLDYAGAALLAGTAALRTGCGLVTVCLPGTVQPVVAGRVPELITHGLPETAPGVIDGRASATAVAELAQDAVLVGPGLRPGRGTTRLVRELLRMPGAPLTIDAGALDALAGIPGWWRGSERPAVVTPHPGEARRLGLEPGPDDAERREAARSAAEAWGQVVVLKGARTVVAGADGRVRVTSFELPALATAGTGDVLAGVITSLMAQGLDTFDAAVLGVYLHGAAAASVSERIGDAGMLAGDLAAQLPRERRHLDGVRERAAGSRLGFEAPAAPPGRAAATD